MLVTCGFHAYMVLEFIMTQLILVIPWVTWLATYYLLDFNHCGCYLCIKVSIVGMQTLGHVGV
jgi:hypothetical protein